MMTEWHLSVIYSQKCFEAMKALSVGCSWSWDPIRSAV